MPQKISLGYQESFRVMGVTATLTVHGPDAHRLVRIGQDMLDTFEQLWSRFLPDSDITRLNNANSKATEVNALTSQLITTMVAAHSETAGLFNPTLLPVQDGYGDRYSLTDTGECTIPDSARPYQDLSGIIFHSPTSISLPRHMTIDAGGIGKGFAADHVADALIRHGASSVSVNIGGDARVMNSAQSVHDWNFDVCDTKHTHIWSTVSLRNGAIATSSMDARHRTSSSPSQHIFSLHNTPSEIAMCSVIAGNATWAEVWTKLLFFSTDLHSDIQRRELAAFIVDTNGNTFASDKWKDYTL